MLFEKRQVPGRVHLTNISRKKEKDLWIHYLSFRLQNAPSIHFGENASKNTMHVTAKRALTMGGVDFNLG